MDKIANLLITLKNGARVGKAQVSVPYSRYKAAIAKALLDYGYITKFEKVTPKKGGPVLVIEPAYTSHGEPKLHDAKRVSKLSCRRYSGVKALQSLNMGRRHLFLSTPKGILESRKACEAQVGGEVLFEVS